MATTKKTGKKPAPKNTEQQEGEDGPEIQLNSDVEAAAEEGYERDEKQAEKVKATFSKRLDGGEAQPADILIRHLDEFLGPVYTAYEEALSGESNAGESKKLQALKDQAEEAGASQGILDAIASDLDRLKAAGKKQAGEDFAAAILNFCSFKPGQIPLQRKQAGPAPSTLSSGSPSPQPSGSGRKRKRGPNKTDEQKEEEARKLEGFLADLKKSGEGWTKRKAAMEGSELEDITHARKILEDEGKIDSRGQKAAAEFRLK